jgi:hypothetical protein
MMLRWLNLVKDKACKYIAFDLFSKWPDRTLYGPCYYICAIVYVGLVVSSSHEVEYDELR